MKRLELMNETDGELVEFGTPNFMSALSDARFNLTIPTGATFDEWCELGKTLANLERGVGWWIGDWWVFGQAKYGERSKAVAEGVFGKRSFGAIRNAGVIARDFEVSRRRDVLSFTHHAEVAALPPHVADALLDRAEAEELSTRELRAEVNKVKNAVGVSPLSTDGCTVDDLSKLVAAGRKFGTIYSDPPWLYDNQGTRAATGNHYGGMTIDELAALPVRDLAADDAHLHLWTTNGRN